MVVTDLSEQKRSEEIMASVRLALSIIEQGEIRSYSDGHSDAAHERFRPSHSSFFCCIDRSHGRGDTFATL